jgi:hypothetical protein
VSSGAPYDAAQAARVAGGPRYRSARAAGDWMRSAGDGPDTDFTGDAGLGVGERLNEAARRRNNQTPEQWAALAQPNRDRLIVAEFTHLPQAERSAAWGGLTERNGAWPSSIGQLAGLSPTEARTFAERERTADYALVTGLVQQGLGLVRQLVDTNNQQELERIRQAARVQAARYTGSADGENAFLNALRLQQGLAGLNQQQLTTRSSGSGGAMIAALVIAAAASRRRK